MLLFDTLCRFARSKLIQSSTVYTIGSLANSVVPFLLMPVLTRYLTSSDYGLITMYQILIAITLPFIGLNAHGIIMRRYYDRDQIDFPNFVANCMYLLVASVVVSSVAISLGRDLISASTQVPVDWLWTVPVLCSGQFINTVLLSLWQVQERPVIYSVYRLLQVAMNLSLSCWLIIGRGWGWQGRVIGELVGTTGFAIVSLVLLWRGHWFRGGFVRAFINDATRFGVGLVPYIIGGLVITVTDRYLISNMVSLADAGIYSVGAQIGMIVTLVESSFNQAYAPWLFERLKNGGESAQVNIVRITYAYYIALTGFALGLAVVSSLFLQYWVGRDFGGSQRFIVWIAMGNAFNGMYKMSGLFLVYLNRTHILSLVFIFTAIINVLGNIFLIRHVGPIGAAQATCLAWLVSFLISWYLAHRAYPMPYWGAIRSLWNREAGSPNA